MTNQTPTPEQIEAAARAMALVDDYDGCFERLDGTDPEEPLSTDAEDAEFWRKRAEAGLAAALAAAPSRPVEGVTLADLAEHFWAERNRPHGPDSWCAGMVYARAQIAVALAAPASAEPGCTCTGYSEYRGGGHFEMMLEPEPDCPEHGAGIAAEVSEDEREADLLRTISDLREEIEIARREREAALEVMNQHRCGEVAERAIARAIKAEAAADVIDENSDLADKIAGMRKVAGGLHYIAQKNDSPAVRTDCEAGWRALVDAVNVIESLSAPAVSAEDAERVEKLIEEAKAKATLLRRAEKPGAELLDRLVAELEGRGKGASDE